MFRFLTKEEEVTFRLWARNNYTPFTEISKLWHPVVQDECRRMCEEKQIIKDDKYNFLHAGRGERVNQTTSKTESERYALGRNRSRQIRNSSSIS